MILLMSPVNLAVILWLVFLIISQSLDSSKDTFTSSFNVTLFVGYFTDKYVKARSFWSLLLIMSFANFALIYIPGLVQLGIWFRLTKGTMPTLWQLLSMGAIPFIAGGAIKVFAAATLAKGITPKEAFNGEADANRK